MPAHVLIETYSVLTRVPAPRRLTGRTAAEAISRLPQEVLTISPNEHLELVEFLGSAGITGGAVHDALIGFTTKRHDLVLLTLDARAAPTYDRVGAGYEFL